jgi:signal transduction histidine kinase
MPSTAPLTRLSHWLERSPSWLLTAVFMGCAAFVTVAMLRAHDAEGVAPWLLLLAAFIVGAYRPAREVAAAAIAMGALLVALLVGDVPDFGGVEFAVTACAFGIVILIGWTMQSRRRRIEAFDRERLAAERRAASDERLRIAQEMHDVVAHSLGLIAVQAGVGMHVIDSDPAEAKRSLESISQASRSSLAEIRRLLGVIRTGDGAPSYTPAPGLADLPRLATDVTAAGLAVDVQIEGDVGGVPPGVGLAAYRIVQEALTNSIRPASASHSVVRLDNGAGELVLEITDDGDGPKGTTGGGNGLVGMRERVAVYGGTLDAGAGPDGGFRVVARLPYDDAER